MKPAAFATFVLVLVFTAVSATAQAPPPDVDPLLPAVFQDSGDRGIVDALLTGNRGEETRVPEPVAGGGLGVGSLGADSAAAGPAVSAALQDPVFARYVDIAQVAAAMHRGDVDRLADQVAQLIEGERILLRSHKALSARRALEFCLSLATSAGQIERLKSVVQHAKREDLAKVIEDSEATQKLSAASRAATVAFTIDELTPERLHFLKDLTSEIDSARRLQDAAGLSVLKATVDALPLLTVKEREYLTERMAAAQATMVAGESEGDDDSLLNLVAGSRNPNSRDEAVRRLILEFVLRLLLELALNNQATLNQSQVGGGVIPPAIIPTSPPPSTPPNRPCPQCGHVPCQCGLTLTGGLCHYNAQPASSVDGQWNSPFGTIWLHQNGHIVTGTGQYYQGGELSLSGQYSGGALALTFQHQTDARIRGVVTFVISPDQNRMDGVFKNTVSGRQGAWVLQR